MSERRLVLSIHGIRTRGAWQKDINRCLERAHFQHALVDYGYFSLLKFLCPWSRDKQIDEFRDRYTAETRDGEIPSVIAHSLGTYIVARAMEKYPELVFDRVIFCGSIVRRSYGWQARVDAGQVQYALNDCGKRDIWVRIAEWVVADAGPSGVSGFADDAGGRVQERIHPFFRHSDYFYERNIEKQWIPFLLGRETQQLTRADRRPWNWKFAIFIVLLLLVFLGAVYLLYAWLHCSDWPWDPIPGPLASMPAVTEVSIPSTLQEPAVPVSDVKVIFRNDSGHNLAVIMYACDHHPKSGGDRVIGWTWHQFYVFDGDREYLEQLPHAHGVYVLFVKGKCDATPVPLGTWNLAEGMFPIITIRRATADPYYAIELTFEKE